MEIKLKKELIQKRKKEVPPHILEMGLNMLFVEPNDVIKYINENNFIPLIEIENLEEDKETKSLFIDFSERQYNYDLDKLGFAKQNNTSMIMLIKDIILDEYQIYMYRIYGADGIIFPTKQITTKAIEKFAFICDSLGMLPIPFIEDTEDLSKIKNWDMLKMVMIKDSLEIPKNMYIAKYNSKKKGIEICLAK